MIRQSLLALSLALVAGMAHAQGHAPGPTGPVNPLLEKASGALGMIRGVGPMRTVAAINTIQFKATGSMVEGGKRSTISALKAGGSFAVPGWRIDIQQSGPGGQRIIHALNGDIAWKESTPGVYAQAAPELAGDLAAQLWSTPQGVIRAAMMADSKDLKVSRAGGADVIEFAVHGMPVKALLDAAGRPTHVEVRVQHPSSGPMLIETDYTGYKDWDGYDVVFPTTTVRKINGVVVLDLTTTEFRSNPYVVFPVPAPLRPQAKPQ